MNFHHYKALYPIFKKTGYIKHTANEFYNEAWDLAKRGNDPTSANRFTAEKLWLKDKRPYYNVWPSIIPMLTRLKLDIDSSLIHLPMKVLEIRLPVDKNHLSWTHKGEQHSIQCVLLSKCNVRGEDGITIWMDLGEVQRESKTGIELPVYTYRNIQTKEGITVDGGLELIADVESLKIGLQLPTDVELDCLRLVCTLCLLANDPEIISPEVLSKNVGKYEKTLDPKFVDKAIRRGKKGWNVGAKIEVSPHYRRNHLALVYYGKGKKLSKIIMRKGSIVHREVVERMPTGRESSA